MISNLSVGQSGGGSTVKIDPDMLAKMEPRTLPPDDVILYLANYVFPDCEAICQSWETLLVGLPETSIDDHIERLMTLPFQIEQFPFILEFHNGPLPNTPLRDHITKPNPTVLDSMVTDETDYVREDGKFLFLKLSLSYVFRF